jgi:hypothetical protein
VTNDTLALQQAVIPANCETQKANRRAVAESQDANCRAIEHDAKFDKLSKPKDFHWWMNQIRGVSTMTHGMASSTAESHALLPAKTGRSPTSLRNLPA